MIFFTAPVDNYFPTFRLCKDSSKNIFSKDGHALADYCVVFEERLYTGN
jgi:hypothetical protein